MQNKSANKSRAKIIYLNASVTLFVQIIQILLGFFIRKLFIEYLGINYLGYNSVFSNILQMLNLADMGIGVAITSFLYKPLADNNQKQVKALMYLYKRIYEILGLVVLLLGLIISLFLEFLVPDAMCSLWYLRILFYINLVGTVSTYYLAYKRTLLIADQKSYFISVVDMISFFLMSGIQVLILLVWPNYILYLVITIAKNIFANIIVSIYSDKNYGKIDKKVDKQLYKEYRPQIFSYVKEVFVSRIGAYIYYSTDNIVISVFRGSLLTGYLSNYTLITLHVSSIVNQVLASIQATFGNYINSNEDINKQKQMANNYLCANFCIGNFCMLCVLFLIQPFVYLFFGAEYVLEQSTAIWLSINLMLTIMIQLPSQIFMIYKLYKYDRPIIIFSAILNIVISVLLVEKCGIDGVLIGTFITSLLYLFSRFYIISKHVYRTAYFGYVIRIFGYFLVSTFSVIIIGTLISSLPGLTIVTFLFRFSLVLLGSIIIPASILAPTKEFSFMINKLLPAKVKAIYSKKLLWIICILFCLCCVLISKVDFSSGMDVDDKNGSRGEIYQQEVSNEEGKVFCLSFDDYIIAFQDITENEEYESIFDNPTFAWLRSLHENYGVVITCYVYYENEDFSLAQCTRRFRQEFIDNSDWLRFGFHTLNEESVYGKTKDIQILKDYQLTIDALGEIVGNQSIDNVVRLQSFQATEEEISLLVNHFDEPIVGLLTADDKRKSYYLDQKENEYIYSHDRMYDSNVGVNFYSTDLRVEYIRDINAKMTEFETDAWNNQLGDLVVFTHEWSLDEDTKNVIDVVCSYAVDNGYRFIFFEDELSSTKNEMGD